MGKVLKNLIEYNGIDSYCYKSLRNFKQLSINETICVPIEQYDIDQITKVWIDYTILDKEIIKTSIGISPEGQILTGYELFISADLNLKIEYSSDNASQSIHLINKTIPIVAYIPIENYFNEHTCAYPSIVIEDIYCNKLDCRHIYTNIVFMVIADVC